MKQSSFISSFLFFIGLSFVFFVGFQNCTPNKVSFDSTQKSDENDQTGNGIPVPGPGGGGGVGNPDPGGGGGGVGNPDPGGGGGVGNPDPGGGGGGVGNPDPGGGGSGGDNPCDPFSPNYNILMCNPKIVGNLYMPKDETGDPLHFNVVDQYIQPEYLAGKISFTDIFVPTRIFTSGFPNITERNEYFGLELDSILTPSSEMPVGSYCLGLISDDGSKLYSGDNSSRQLIINNDGTHSTKFKSTTLPIALNGNFPIKVTYYQGPKTEISLVLIFKQWSTGQACPTYNLEVTKNFFVNNFNAGSPLITDRSFSGEVNTPYKKLYEDGWRPVPQNSYQTNH